MGAYAHMFCTTPPPAARSSFIRVALGRSCSYRPALRARRPALQCSAAASAVLNQRGKDEGSAALQELSITRRVEETVLPVPSQHPGLHELSELDQLLRPDVSAPIIMFFNSAGGLSAEEAVHSLKRALRDALAIFYPMAGRLIQRPGSATRLDVSCLDQGALFCEAWADGPLSFFHPDFQPHPAFHFLCPIPFSSVPDALLYIQVTHFTCGGFCICVQERHILSDGVSLFHFLESWVEILNGRKGITLYPFMDLSILKDGYKISNMMTPSSEYAQNFLESTPINFDTQNMLEFTSRIFHFTPCCIKALRDQTQTLPHATAYECLMAYLWQNVIRTHQYSFHERTRLAFPVDIRKRLIPRLPSGYFGNALLTGFAYTKVEDLVAKQGMAHAMKLIRNATSTIKSDYIKLAFDWLGKQQSPPFFCVASEKSHFANTWTRIPFNQLNFPWGKPCCFRTYLPPNLAGEFVLILPSELGKGHFDVQVNLEYEHMLKFQASINDYPLKK